MIRCMRCNKSKSIDEFQLKNGQMKTCNSCNGGHRQTTIVTSTKPIPAPRPLPRDVVVPKCEHKNFGRKRKCPDCGITRAELDVELLKEDMKRMAPNQSDEIDLAYFMFKKTIPRN